MKIFHVKDESMLKTILSGFHSENAAENVGAHSIKNSRGSQKFLLF